MIYTSLIAGLIVMAAGQYEPEDVTGSVAAMWTDFVDCDHDKWAFDNPDPLVHARHRDGFEDQTGGVCFYGEWSASGNDGNGNSRDNLWSEKQWQAVDVDSDLMLYVNVRLFAFCDYEPADELVVYLRDMWQNEGVDADDQTDDVWDREREIARVGKNRNNCDGWDFEMTNGNTDWLDELSCTTGNQGTSCWTEIGGTYPMTKGNNGNGLRWGLRIEGEVNNAFNNEAWAYGGIKFTVNPEVDGTACCTGTRSDHPVTKSCSAFGEERNCVRKGCDWSERDECQFDCCRKDDSSSKRKSKCKSFSNLLNTVDDVCDISGERRDCFVSKCDCNGFWDGIGPLPTNPCPPANN